MQLKANEIVCDNCHCKFDKESIVIKRKNVNVEGKCSSDTKGDISSVGRAIPCQGIGHRFEPDILHFFISSLLGL